MVRALVPFVLAADTQLRVWCGQQTAVDAVKHEVWQARVVAFCNLADVAAIGPTSSQE